MTRECAICGRVGPPEEFIVSQLRGKTFCTDAQKCDELAKRREPAPDRVRTPLPDRNLLKDPL